MTPGVRVGSPPTEDPPPPGEPPEPPSPVKTAGLEGVEVRVVRSERRRRTVQARLEGDVLTVRVPAHLSSEEERDHVERLKRRLERRMLKREIDKDTYLDRRFDDFNRFYFGGRLEVRSIEFSTDQAVISGSCTPSRGTIRVSHRLLDMPRWVLDYVIMHEMAHLVHRDHSSEFWEKVGEYPLSERARGFLIAKGMEDDDAEGSRGGGP